MNLDIKGLRVLVTAGANGIGLAIARAFAREPVVLFADEPTGNLDTRTGERIIDLLFELNARASTTLVLVTHEDDVAARAERVAYFRDGRIERWNERAKPAETS